MNLSTPELVKALELLRTYIKRPITIISAYRCPIHNAEVGGAGHSQHLLGNAADIMVPGMNARELYEKAMHIGPFMGFGVNDDNGSLHVDIRPTFAHWCYKASPMFHGKFSQVAWYEVKVKRERVSA